MIFCSILPFQAAYAASVTKASPSGVSVSTKYNHMYFNYYSPENKKTKARLLKIENWLADMQKKIDTWVAGVGKTKQTITLSFFLSFSRI